MFYAPKSFIFENKTQKVLKEGGAAAETLIDKVLDPDGSKGLKFSKIPKEKLEIMFKKISVLLKSLRESGFIESVEPSFQLGSTRLAKFSQTKDPTLLKPGEEEAIDKALRKKESFGDLDIDVEFKEDKIDDIFDFINSQENFAAKINNNQIHIAIVDGTNVYQVDLVNVKNKRNLYNFKEKSSVIDISRDIKGAFSIILLRALASTKNPGREAEKVYQDQVELKEKNDENAIKIVKAKEANRIPTAVRYSLGDKGLVVKLVLEDDPNNPPRKSRKAQELNISAPAEYDYDNLDELAKYLLSDESATGNDIYHAVFLAKKIKNLPNKQKIWDYFVKSAEINLKQGIDLFNYEVGMNELEKIIFEDNNQNETITEGRQGISRFVGASKFSDTKAFSILKDIAKNSELKNNKLIIDFNKDNIFLVEKMDSSFCHFGLDSKKRFFFESSNSKPVYSETANKKLGFSPDFLETFKDLENNKNFQKSLKTIFNKYGPFKFSAELFPTLTHKGTRDEQIIFVGVPYSKDKFGTKGGFVIFNINLLNNQGSYQPPDYELDNKITSKFKELSQKDGWGDEWKIYTNNEDMKKTSEMLEVELEPELFKALKNDSEYKQKNLAIPVRKAGVQIQNFLDKKANEFSSNLSSKDNSFIEGLVLKSLDEDGNITEIKGTSDLFDERKKEYWKDRKAIEKLEENFNNELLINVLKFKTANPRTLNKMIVDLGQEFKAKSDSDISLRQQFYNYLLNNLTDLEPKEIKEVKFKATEIIKEFDKKYENLLKDFKINQKNLDPDSIRKTNEWFASFKKKFDNIKNSINENLNENYLFNLTASIIGRRVDNRVNFDPGQEEKENNRENVIIWNGRAQPWHFGHHAMIEKGISKLEETKSDKVLIFLVKGSGGPTIENPLTFEQQLKLLNSIYANNKKVEIVQSPLNSSFYLDPINALHDLNYNLSGWLAGSDRIGKYKENLLGFNVNTFKEDHNFSPVSRNSKGLLNLTFIPTERKFSGTESRFLALSLPFEKWLAEITKGMNLPSSAKEVYKVAYNQIYKVFKDSVKSAKTFEDWLNKIFTKKQIDNLSDEEITKFQNTYKKLSGFSSSGTEEPKQPGTTPEQSGGTPEQPGDTPEEQGTNNAQSDPFFSGSSLGEGSTMAAGAVGGFAGKRDKIKNRTIYREMQENYFIKRENLMEELKLRKAIRNIITENKKKELNEEQRLRSVIRKMLTEAKQADEVVYQSTGVNKLRDLLRNIIPSIQDDYKDLTTSIEQRQAYINHLMTGIKNLLNIADLSKNTKETSKELEEDIEINVFKKDPSKIDLGLNKKEKPAPEPEDSRSEEEKLVSGDEMPLDPDQLTGMREAAITLKKIKTQITDTYETLSNPEDEKAFKDYILPNIEAHIEEFESEITANSEVEVENPEGSVEAEEPAVEDQLELSEDLLYKLSSLL